MGLDSADIPYAAERGVNLWLYGRSFGKATVPLKALLAHEREKHVVVMLGTFVLTPRGARRTVEKARRELGIDCAESPSADLRAQAAAMETAFFGRSDAVKIPGTFPARLELYR